MSMEDIRVNLENEEIDTAEIFLGKSVVMIGEGIRTDTGRWGPLYYAEKDIIRKHKEKGKEEGSEEDIIKSLKTGKRFDTEVKGTAQYPSKPSPRGFVKGLTPLVDNPMGIPVGVKVSKAEALSIYQKWLEYSKDQDIEDSIPGIEPAD